MTVVVKVPAVTMAADTRGSQLSSISARPFGYAETGPGTSMYVVLRIK